MKRPSDILQSFLSADAGKRVQCSTSTCSSFQGLTTPLNDTLLLILLSLKLFHTHLKPQRRQQVQSYRTVCLMKRSGSWAVKVVRGECAGRPSSSLMDLGLGLNSGLSLRSRIRTETVDVDCRGRWMPRARGTSFSASTVSMKERVCSKSMGWMETGGGWWRITGYSYTSIRAGCASQTLNADCLWSRSGEMLRTLTSFHHTI